MVIYQFKNIQLLVQLSHATFSVATCVDELSTVKKGGIDLDC